MDPFRKVVKTEKEKNELLRQKRTEWDAIPPELKMLVAPSCEDYLETFAETIIVEQAPFVQPRAATIEEETALTARVMNQQIMGDRSGDRYDGLSGELRAAAKANDEAEFQKLIGAPAKRAESALDGMIRKALESVVVKGRRVPPRESERPAMPLAKRAGSGRVEYDPKIDESTEYSADGAYVGFWKGSPAHRPQSLVAG